MKEIGVITEIKNRECLVRFDRKSACENCKMCLKSSDEMFVELLVENTLDAKEGDRVEIEMPDNTVLKASFIVYIIPAATLLTTLVLTQNMADWASFSLAIAVLISTYGIVAATDRYLKKKKGFIPKMVKLYRTQGDCK